ncbi:MAG TPA: hypothetical protein VMG11_06860 [Steroidobacteraceae bacterium]|nr:hypothetical protein [Steroidobacteraceae bacterium]
MIPTVLVATWRDGVFIAGTTLAHELAGHHVCGLTHDGHGAALAIIDEHSLCARAVDGTWRTLASSELALACCVSVGGTLYAGTDDARVLRLVQGALEPLRSFDEVAGRATWYAGAALINGQLLGPPLGIRSMCATCDQAVVLANVHVGGIPRSSDAGVTWQPTIPIDTDVHQVSAHPKRPELVAAAAAVGLCMSRDGGVTWTTEQEGLHAPYCAAVAFCGDDVLVSAATDHFASEGGIYRRAIEQRGPLSRVNAGLPRWLSGIPDTGCIAATGKVAAIADRRGHLYVSLDAGGTWKQQAEGLPPPSGVLVC